MGLVESLLPWIIKGKIVEKASCQWIDILGWNNLPISPGIPWPHVRRRQKNQLGETRHLPRVRLIHKQVSPQEVTSTFWTISHLQFHSSSFGLKVRSKSCLMIFTLPWRRRTIRKVLKEAIIQRLVKEVRIHLFVCDFHLYEHNYIASLSFSTQCFCWGRKREGIQDQDVVRIQ